MNAEPPLGASSRTTHLLVAAMARLDEDRVLRLVQKGLHRGQSPADLLALAREGLEQVGRVYNDGGFFLADLLMAAQIFRQVLDLLSDVAPMEPDPHLPPIVFGTVQGDIHEIGKNVTIAFMRYNGLRIIDLGRDVAPQRFVDAVRATRSPVVCMSGSLSTGFGSMRRTITMLGSAGLRYSTAVVIGGQVSESVRDYVGADFWAEDYAEGVDICRRVLMAHAEHPDDQGLRAFPS